MKRRERVDNRNKLPSLAKKEEKQDQEQSRGAHKSMNVEKEELLASYALNNLLHHGSCTRILRGSLSRSRGRWRVVIVIQRRKPEKSKNLLRLAHARGIWIIIGGRKGRAKLYIEGVGSLFRSLATTTTSGQEYYGRYLNGMFGFIGAGCRAFARHRRSVGLDASLKIYRLWSHWIALDALLLRLVGCRIASDALPMDVDDCR